MALQRRTSYIRGIVALLCVAALALTMLSGCEQVVDADDIPYVERIVVRGKLRVGQEITNIMITRTLPLNESFTAEKAALTDAVATITTTGGLGFYPDSTYTLVYRGNGMFDVPGLVVVSGITYTLNVAWRGKSVHASTTAPMMLEEDIYKVTIEKFRDIGWNGLFEVIVPTVTFATHGNPVYLMTFDLLYGGSTNEPQYPMPIRSDQRIVRTSDTAADGLIHLRGSADNQYYGREDVPVTGLSMKLYSFDYPFYEYYETERQGDFDINSDIFGSSGGQTKWNVEGDGFGMFIAESVVQKVVPVV